MFNVGRKAHHNIFKIELNDKFKCIQPELIRPTERKSKFLENVSTFDNEKEVPVL